MTKRMDLPEKKICDSYQSGISIKTLSEKHMCSRGVIYRRLVENGVHIRNREDVMINMNPMNNPDNVAKISTTQKQRFKDDPNLVIENSKRVKQYYKDNPNARIGNGKRIKQAHIDDPTIAERISASCQGIPYNKWTGFAKEKTYCEKFDDECRESNREKYDNVCFICGKPQSENITKTGKIRKLSVHHVDMNRWQGCDGNDWKLVPLCMVCHVKAHSRVWEARIEYLLNDPLMLNK